MTRSALVQTFKITLPVFFGYVAGGIPFGLLLVKTGYPLYLALLMSLFIYAGAGQYLAVGLFAAGASLSSILIAMLLLNIRHVVYGLSLIKPFREAGRWRPYLIFALSDETYALLTAVSPPPGVKPGEFYGAVALLNQSYWVAATVVGGIAGALLPFSFQGVDFALTALFAVLVVDQLKKSRDPLPALVGAAATVGMVFLAPSSHLLLASLGAGMAGLVLLRGRRRDAP